MKKLFVLGVAALLLVAFSVPAMADVKIGGIIFTDFYYLDRDKDNSISKGMGPDSFTNTAIQLPNITRLYARWTNEDNVGMYIEFGLGQSGGNTIKSSSTSAGIRHAYGWWDVNPMFQILAGHSTTPFSPLNPSQLLGTRSGSVNIIGVGYGDFYSGRFTQVRGTFKFGKAARLEIALVDPNGTLAAGKYGPWNGAEGTDYQTNSTIPRFDISVPLYLGPVHLYPGFLYQYRTVDRLGTANNGVDNSINTYIGTLGLKMGFGPFGIAAEGNWGENWGNTRGLAGTSPSAGLSSARLMSDNTIEDAETYSFWIDLSYKFGPVTPHLIYGQQKSKVKEDIGLSDIEAKSQMYGVSIPIDLAKGFRVRPELMWYDDGDSTISGKKVDYGKYFIGGVQFQITF
ncbi:MAG: porin [Deltaproteobacteria bacterium]|nr:porin [Deltaproteobacteria bacterium]